VIDPAFVAFIAAVVLALGVPRDELYAEVAPLAEEQVKRTLGRLLAEADAKRRSAS
jgi:hypothetical protein